MGARFNFEFPAAKLPEIPHGCVYRILGSPIWIINPLNLYDRIINSLPSAPVETSFDCVLAALILVRIIYEYLELEGEVFLCIGILILSMLHEVQFYIEVLMFTLELYSYWNDNILCVSHSNFDVKEHYKTEDRISNRKRTAVRVRNRRDSFNASDVWNVRSHGAWSLWRSWLVDVPLFPEYLQKRFERMRSKNEDSRYELKAFGVYLSRFRFLRRGARFQD